MKQRKRRVLQHIMEEDSYHVINSFFPKEWVVRQFNRPDYGIDLVIELFDKIDDKTYETLGEFVYVQVKSVQHLSVKTEKIYPVSNVAKGKWLEDKSQYMDIQTVKYSFDTKSIYTIQTLGASVSVLLFLVDLSTKDVYFLCLNDYIDKIILPQNPYYTNQENLILTLPVLNNLKNTDLSKNALRFYGKRAKLLSAFSKFHYQKNELSNLLGVDFFSIDTDIEDIEKNKIVEQALFFIEQIEELDIWEYKEWSVLPDAKEEIKNLKRYLRSEFCDLSTAKKDITINWDKLTNISSIYEDVCREWFLPKVISFMTSYPNAPKMKSQV